MGADAAIAAVVPCNKVGTFADFTRTVKMANFAGGGSRIGGAMYWGVNTNKVFDKRLDESMLAN